MLPKSLASVSHLSTFQLDDKTCIESLVVKFESDCLLTASFPTTTFSEKYLLSFALFYRSTLWLIGPCDKSSKSTLLSESWHSYTADRWSRVTDILVMDSSTFGNECGLVWNRTHLQQLFKGSWQAIFCFGMSWNETLVLHWRLLVWK